MTPDDPRYARAREQALEFARQRIAKIIAEARARRCLFYKAIANAGSGAVILHSTDAENETFRRTLNCSSFFEKEGFHFNLGEACNIHDEVNELFHAAGGFEEYRIAKFIRQDRRRSKRQTSPLGQLTL